MPHPISESKEREFENRRRTAVCAAYRATPWRATEGGPGCVRKSAPHSGAATQEASAFPLEGGRPRPPDACGKARRTAARLHKQAYSPVVSGDGGPPPSSLETCLSQKPSPAFNHSSRRLEIIWKSGKQEGNGPCLLSFPDVPDFLIQLTWSSFDFDSDSLSQLKTQNQKLLTFLLRSPMKIGSSLLDIGYSIALPQVETCLSQKPSPAFNHS